MFGFKKRKILIAVVCFTLFGISAVWISARGVYAIQRKAYEKIKVFTEIVSIIEDNYVDEVDTTKLIYGAIRGMLNTMDPHSSFMSPEQYKEMRVETRGSFGGLGIEITMKDGILMVVSPIEDTPAFRAGIKAGDKIVKIEDKHTRDMTIQEAVKLMRGKKGTKITIWIMREGFDKPKAFEITRDVIKIKSVKSKMLDDDYGYVRITQFQHDTGKELRKALKNLEGQSKGLKGLILDLRNNPGGLLNEAVSVSDTFLRSGLIVYTEGRVKGQEMRFSAGMDGIEPDYPVVVLINGGSASASEIVAGALQDHKKAVIIGTTSFGKGSVQSIIPLEDGSALRLTTSKYFTPSGRSIQAKGIKPDIFVAEGTVTEKKVNNRHISEKDLKRHLVVEPETKDDKTKKESKEKISDLQLLRALEYLKSWYIFREVAS